eukprot:scaffold62796_cov39-Prasinocladus_malaysianus.AAC.1
MLGADVEPVPIVTEMPAHPRAEQSKRKPFKVLVKGSSNVKEQQPVQAALPASETQPEATNVDAPPVPLVAPPLPDAANVVACPVLLLQGAQSAGAVAAVQQSYAGLPLSPHEERLHQMLQDIQVSPPPPPSADLHS